MTTIYSKSGRKLNQSLSRYMKKFLDSTSKNHTGIVTNIETNDITISLRDTTESIDLSYSEGLLLMSDVFTNFSRNDAVILIPIIGRYLVIKIENNPSGVTP